MLVLSVQEAQTPSIGTPGSHAPTPLSATFANGHNMVKDSASAGVPTPTSATGIKAPKKTKKAMAGAAEDSETDSKESGKKMRTAFGVIRK